MAPFRSCRNGYMHIVSWGEAIQPFLMLAIRLFWGYAFFIAGKGKLADIDSVARFFSSLSIPFPEFNAHLVAWTELLGGLFLMIGILSRLASLPLIIAMCVAYYTAHSHTLASIFSDPQLLVQEAPFNFLFAALLIFAYGPGKISIDHIFRSRWGK